MFTKIISLVFAILTAMLQANSSTHAYAIATGEQDRERLTILNELYNRSSLALLELSPGTRVLTLGCGIALLELEMTKQVGPSGAIYATDYSLEQLEIAARNCKNEGVQFSQLDIADLRQIQGEFDRIHCRFVLTHQPWQVVERAIPALYALLAPGGFLLLEEIATLDSLVTEPRSDLGYEMWKVCIQKQFQAQGSDSELGKKLFARLKQEGYDVSYTSHQPILQTPRERSLLTLGVRSVAERVIHQNLMSPKEITETVLLLERLEQDATLLTRYVEVAQIRVNRR